MAEYPDPISDATHDRLVAWLVQQKLLAPHANHLPLSKIMAGQNLSPLLGHQLPGQLSVGLPWPAFSQSAMPETIFWFPQSLPAGRSVHVASSRLGQKVDEQDRWFDALRTLAIQLLERSDFLVSAERTTANPFVQRIGKLFDIPVVSFTPFPDKFDLLNLGSASTSEQPQPCFFQPLNENEISLDRLLIQISAEVRAFSVRQNGNIYQAIQGRLNDLPNPNVHLLLDQQLTKKRTQTELLTRGATGWWLYQTPNNQLTTNSLPTNNPPTPKPPTQVLTLGQLDAKQYLLHWTRRRVGPWPDQNETQYLDDLIFQTDRRQHDELAALARILASRKILASRDLTRSPQPVVCFSNLPLTELTQYTTFRPHLSRWDFLPLGLAIDRQWLQKHFQARPVTYGDQQQWHHLPEPDRPFFQLNQSQKSKIDWQIEQEWRIVGDLDLNRLPQYAAIVFVPDTEAANLLATLSRWPIVVLDSKENRNRSR